MALPRGNLGRDVHFSEAVSGVQQIVRSTEQANVQRVGRAMPRERLAVIELEKRPPRAAPTICRNERALPTVARVSFTPHIHRHVASTVADRQRTGLALRRFGRRRVASVPVAR